MESDFDDDQQPLMSVLIFDFIFFFNAGHDYNVEVHTGKKMGSGTDANVFINFFGPLGQSGKLKLDNAKNNFETGK